MALFSHPPPAVYEAARSFVTYGTLSQINPKQRPSKGKPWSTLKSLEFVRRVDFVFPQEVLAAVQEKIIQKKTTPQFKRVTMSLSDVVTGAFFSEYIKKGDVLMLSEGRVGIDNVYALREGKLVLYLDKETYERAGLVGAPHGFKGKRGFKPRWVVEADLKSESMRPGKKGYDRLVYAAKNALSTPTKWFFSTIPATSPDPDPLEKHSPTDYTSYPDVVRDISAVVPPLVPSSLSFGPGGRDLFNEFSEETYEWLSLVRLGSPRVSPHDNIDPYLSRYQLPGEPEHQHKAMLCKVSWEGFFPASWTRDLLIDLISALPSKTWFIFSASTFVMSLTGDNSECCILRSPESPDKFIMWEVKSHE